MGDAHHICLSQPWAGVIHGSGTQVWPSPTGERRIALRRKILLLAGLALTVTLAFLCGCQSNKQDGSHPSRTTAEAQAAEQASQTQGGQVAEARSELGPKGAKIMGSSPYRYAEWGYLEVDPSDGSTVRSVGPSQRLYIPGSSTKLVSVSATINKLGFDHRIKTPFCAEGDVKNGTLHGNLVLVASGALTMGGRTAPNRTISYPHIDHTYASSVPGANEFRELLPVMGVDVSLQDNCKNCPAKRKVFAKVGTVGLPDLVNGGPGDNESLGGTWRSNQVPSTTSTYSSLQWK
jgi:D-alanyl-D-alanine carboxypeptidase